MIGSRKVQITKREIIFSIVIVCVMLIFGFIIGNKINDRQMQKNAEYYTAIHIDNDRELFEYGMRTDLGNAFIYGELRAVDAISYGNLKGEYIYIKRITEEYTRHTREVKHTETDKDGNTHTYYTTEEYYTWDEIASEYKHCSQISLLNITFSYKKFLLPKESYITTVDTGYHLRDVFYGIKAVHTGTVYTQLKDKTISSNSKLYDGKSIDETIKYLTSDNELISFWCLWIFLIICIVALFYILDNRWLDD